jgi:hypothetical protein
MLRRRKDPKPRAKKKPRFPVKPWQPLIHFLNDEPLAKTGPYAVSLDTGFTRLTSFWPSPWAVSPDTPLEVPYFQFHSTRQGKNPLVLQVLRQVAPLLADSPKPSVPLSVLCEQEVPSPEEFWKRAWAKRPFFEGIRFLETWTEWILTSSRVSSPFTWDNKDFPGFHLAVHDRPSVAILLLARLHFLGEAWRLRRCEWCEKFFLKRIARKFEHDYCSDDCRYAYRNEEKREEKRKAREKKEAPEQPMERVPLRRSSGGRRHLKCSAYQTCLDETKVKGWKAFTCEECAQSPFD